MAGTRGWRSGEAVAIAALALASGAFLWFITGPPGIGLTNDSISYLDMARSLEAGDGLRRWSEDPVTTWPFLFPLLLAATSKGSGLAVLDAGRLLAAATSVLLSFATWGVLRRTVTDVRLRVAGVVVVVFGSATVSIARVLLTDQLFAAGTVLFLLVILLAVETGRRRWIAAAAAVVSALFATRYVGALLVPTGAALLAAFPVDRSRRRARLRNAAWFTVAALVVPVLYTLRNRAVSGTAFKQNPSALGGGNASYAELPRSLGTWFVGSSGGGTTGVIGVLGTIAVTVAAVMLVTFCVRRSRASEPIIPVVTARGVVAAAWLVLAALTLLLRAVLAFDLDDRTLLGLFAPAVILVAAACDAVASGAVGARRVGRRSVATWVVVLFVVASVGAAVLGVRAGLLFRGGGSGYAATRWAPTLEELAAADLGARLPAGCDRRSNDPNAAYLAGLETSPPPGAPGGQPEGDAPLCLVWVDLGAGPDGAGELDGLRSRFDLVPIIDGATFSVFVSRG